MGSGPGKCNKIFGKAPAATFQDKKTCFFQAKKAPAATLQHQKTIFHKKMAPAATSQH